MSTHTSIHKASREEAANCVCHRNFQKNLPSPKISTVSTGDNFTRFVVCIWKKKKKRESETGSDCGGCSSWPDFKMFTYFQEGRRMEGLLCRLPGHVDSIFGTVYRVYCQIMKLSADLFVDNADVTFIFNFDATLPLCPESPFFFKPHSSIWPQQCDNNKSIQRKLPQLIKSQLRPRLRPRLGH